MEPSLLSTPTITPRTKDCTPNMSISLVSPLNTHQPPQDHIYSQITSEENQNISLPAIQTEIKVLGNDFDTLNQCKQDGFSLPPEGNQYIPQKQEIFSDPPEEVKTRTGYNSTFMTALAQFLQSLLSNSFSFNHLVQISGHMYLSVDDQHTLEYVLDEKICKTDTENIFIGSSYCNIPGQPSEDLSETRISRLKVEDNSILTPASDVRVVEVDRSAVVDFMSSMHGSKDQSHSIAANGHEKLSAMEVGEIGVKASKQVSVGPVPVFCDEDISQKTNQKLDGKKLIGKYVLPIAEEKTPVPKEEIIIRDFLSEKSEVLDLKKNNLKQTKCIGTYISSKDVIEEETDTYFKLRSTRKMTGDVLCIHCGKAYSSASALRDHERFIHQGAPRYTCNVCQRGFNSRTIYQCHMDSHNNRKSFMCAVCAKAFRYNKGLQDHMVAQHGAEAKVRQRKILKCSHAGCNRVFQSKTLLAAHFNSHQNVNSYKCSLCAKDFRYSTSLKDHMVRAHQAKGSNCPKCDRTFPNPYELNRHMKACGKQKCFKCPYCNKSSSYEANLKRHIRDQHGTGGNFKCPKCETVSTNLHESRQHIKACGRKDVFHCEQCVQVFSWESNYKKHIKKFHPQIQDGDKKRKTVPATQGKKRPKNK